MLDPRVEEHLAARHVLELLVERDGVQLSAKGDAGVAAVSRLPMQCRHERTADGLTAVLREHRDTPDVWIAGTAITVVRVVEEQAARADGSAAERREHVDGAGHLGRVAVVCVDLLVLRHALLLDEHATADFERCSHLHSSGDALDIDSWHAGSLGRGAPYHGSRFASTRGAGVTIDWAAVQEEALAVFREYIRIDTSNPPGNEGVAARYLGGLLEAEGVAVEYIEAEVGRDILVARLEASSAQPDGALMLGNHTDVVPVEPEFWDHDPFAADVVDGRVYGRGAVDMKGVGVMQLFAMILARREGLALKRDLVFVAVPDEEMGSDAGMLWLVEHRPDIVDVAFALNEGASGQPDFGGQEARLFQIAVTEKEMAPIRLTTVGTPGHGARPHQDNSAVRLARAIGRLADWDRGIVITPETRDFLERLQAGGLIEDPDDLDAVQAAVAKSPDTLAAFTNTLNVTIVNSGIKSNVIPARSEAIIDCRLLPGESRLAWVQAVRDYLDDPGVEVALQYPHERAQVVSETDTELYRVIESVLHDAVEDALIVPGVSIVGTDNRFLRPLGVPSYGFIPCLLSQEERDGFHGNNEFLTIDNFNMGLELMYEVVRRCCSELPGSRGVASG